MTLKMIGIIVFAALLAQFGQPTELRNTAAKTSYKNVFQAAAAAAERSMETVYSKGVLVRRPRLRSRLNTHLLKKK